MTRQLILGLIASVGVCAGAFGDNGDSASNRGILGLAPGASIDAVNAQYGLSTIASIPAHGIYLVSLPTTMTELQFEQLFINDPAIDESELDYESGDPGPGGQSFFLAGSMLEFSLQPSRYSLGLSAAHGIATGAGVMVAVVDTGVDATHPQLAGAIAPGGYNFINNTTDSSDVGNGLDDNNNNQIDELLGHGTFVAGLIHMVAPDASILPVRVMNADGITTSFIVAQGIYYAVDQGASVINLSLGTLAQDEMIKMASDYAAELGVIVVSSTGNFASTVPMFPAKFSSVIATSAVDTTDHLASFSNYGGYVDLTAPGVNLISTLPGNQYGTSSGTSYATPLVSGAAAILKSIGSVRTRSDFRNIINNTAVDIDGINPGVQGEIGMGRLDVAAAALLASITCGNDADINFDGTFDVADFFLFVGLYANQDSDADFNDDKIVDVLDFFQFIQLFNTGCP